MTRTGDWIQTYSGRRWWPHDPRPEDVHHEDFPAISQVVRFGGHCRGLYTVAQHSCLVYDYVALVHGGGDAPDREACDALCRSALTHDLHEIYPPGDQLSPFLRPLDATGIHWLRSVSDSAAACVRKRLEVPYALPGSVTHADLVLLATERRDILVTPECLLPFWAQLPEPWSQRIEVWPAERAWAEWRDRFTACFGWTPGDTQ
ncbi:MAG TPA: hypothetical protein VFB99_13770 [Vicinamibacterales bacterium]|nr:hypothetical protein [Vicinamibacterales bacterium]